MPGYKENSIGSRAEVMHSTKHKTKGGLKKEDLMYNKKGRIVSKLKHEIGLKSHSFLTSNGYKTEKGSFRLFTKKR